MGAIDSSSGRRFLAGFVTLAVISGITLGIAKVTTTLYALSLQATPLELALLGAAQSVGILAVSLPVGRNRSLSGVLFPPAPTRNNPSHVHQRGCGSDQGDSEQHQVAAA